MLEILGIVSCFLLMVLFDINDIKWKKRMGRFLFAAGMCGIIFISCRTVWQSLLQIDSFGADAWICIGMAALFFLLLIYTLFFAIPADEAYSKATIDNDRRFACTTGMYALSRHPGVLWMALFYVCGYGAVPTKEMFRLFLVTTICNVLYVLLQDLWTFPRLFSNYAEYKNETPFLIPTGKSIRRAVTTWSKKQKENKK